MMLLIAIAVCTLYQENQKLRNNKIQDSLLFGIVDVQPGLLSSMQAC